MVDLLAFGRWPAPTQQSSLICSRWVRAPPWTPVLGAYWAATAQTAASAAAEGAKQTPPDCPAWAQVRQRSSVSPPATAAAPITGLQAAAVARSSLQTQQ